MAIAGVEDGEKVQLKGLSGKMVGCKIWRHVLKELYFMHRRGTHGVQFAHNWRQRVARVDGFSLALVLRTPVGLKYRNNVLCFLSRNKPDEFAMVVIPR